MAIAEKPSDNFVKTRPNSPVPVLVVAWPPVRENGPWFIEVRAPKGSIRPKIVVPPIAGLDDPRAELLAEGFIKSKIPGTWGELLLPISIAASEVLIPSSPCDYAAAMADVELVRAVVQAFRLSLESASGQCRPERKDETDVAVTTAESSTAISSFQIEQAFERAVRSRVSKRRRSNV